MANEVGKTLVDSCNWLLKVFNGSLIWDITKGGPYFKQRKWDRPLKLIDSTATDVCCSKLLNHEIEHLKETIICLMFIM